MNLRPLVIARKELLQLRRDRLTLAMMAVMPVVLLLLFGYAINTDVRHIPTLVDDLGGWLTGTLDRNNAWDDGPVEGPVVNSIEDSIESMLAAVGAFGSTLVLVSPEVGLTVVPASASGRRFADELGSLNQRVAELCDQVVLVVAGQAVPIKQSGS